MVETINRARVEPSATRQGLNIYIGEGAAPVVSDTWSLGGWRVRFARLGPGQRLNLDPAEGTPHVKVVTGRLTTPSRGAYAPPKVVVTTRVDGDHIVAGAEGAIVTILIAGVETRSPVRAMGQLVYSGPHADKLEWISFEKRVAGFTKAFDGVDAHASPGFHLIDANGEEIAYVWVWTAGKGADMTTHNHGNAPRDVAPAFAETHLVLFNGTGRGGMYETPEPGSPERTRTPLQQGDEHGPFFHIDAAKGGPLMLENGAVSYPWHSWQAGTDDEPGQTYDVVTAFEITAPYARVNA